MNEKHRKSGVSFIGVLFLGLGAFKFFSGEDWVVWIILGVLLGGLSFIGGKKDVDAE